MCEFYVVKALLVLCLLKSAEPNRFYTSYPTENSQFLGCQNMGPVITSLYSLSPVAAIKLITAPLDCASCNGEVKSVRTNLIAFATNGAFNTKQILAYIDNTQIHNSYELLLTTLMAINEYSTLPAPFKRQISNVIFYFLKKRYLGLDNYSIVRRGFCEHEGSDRNQFDDSDNGLKGPKVWPWYGTGITNVLPHYGTGSGSPNLLPVDGSGNVPYGSGITDLLPHYGSGNVPLGSGSTNLSPFDGSGNKNLLPFYSSGNLPQSLKSFSLLGPLGSSSLPTSSSFGNAGRPSELPSSFGLGNTLGSLSLPASNNFGNTRGTGSPSFFGPGSTLGSSNFPTSNSFPGGTSGSPLLFGPGNILGDSNFPTSNSVGNLGGISGPSSLFRPGNTLGSLGLPVSSTFGSTKPSLGSPSLFGPGSTLGSLKFPTSDGLGNSGPSSFFGPGNILGGTGLTTPSGFSSPIKSPGLFSPFGPGSTLGSDFSTPNNFGSPKGISGPFPYFGPGSLGLTTPVGFGPEKTGFGSPSPLDSANTFGLSPLYGPNNLQPNFGSFSPFGPGTSGFLTSPGTSGFIRAPQSPGSFPGSLGFSQSYDCSAANSCQINWLELLWQRIITALGDNLKRPCLNNNEGSMSNRPIQIEKLLILLPQPEFTLDREMYERWRVIINSPQIQDIIRNLNFPPYATEEDILDLIIQTVTKTTTDEVTREVFSFYTNFREAKRVNFNVAVLIEALPTPVTIQDQRYYAILKQLLFSKVPYQVTFDGSFYSASTLNEKLLILLNQLINTNLLQPDMREAVQFYLSFFQSKTQIRGLISLLPPPANPIESEKFTMLQQFFSSSEFTMLVQQDIARQENFESLLPDQKLGLIFRSVINNPQASQEIREVATYYRNILVVKQHGFNYFNLLNLINVTEEDQLAVRTILEYFYTPEFDTILSQLKVSSLSDVEKLRIILETITTKTTNVTVIEASRQLLQKIQFQGFLQSVRYIIQTIPLPNSEEESAKYDIVTKFLVTPLAFQLLGPIDFTMFPESKLLLEFIFRTVVESNVQVVIKEAFSYYLDLTERLESVELITKKEIKKKFKLTEIFTDTLDLRTLSFVQRNAFKKFFQYIIQVRTAMEEFDAWDQARTRGEFMKLLFKYLVDLQSTPPDIKEVIFILDPLIKMDGKGALPP